MKVIPGITISDLNLSSSNAVEPLTASAWSSGATYNYGDLASEGGLIYISLVASNNNHDPAVSPLYWALIGPAETNWSSGTTYAINDYAVYNHRVYQSLQNANLNNNPYTAATWWQDVGPSNAWAMFDTERDTATSAASPLTFTIAPGTRVNAIGFLDIVADSIEVSISIAPYGVVYDVVTPLAERTGIINGYTYFYTPFTTQDKLVLFDLPTDTNAIITVTLLRASGRVSLGAVVVGVANELGAAQHDGASNEFLNFSTISNDEFGNNVLIRRRGVSEPAITVWAPNYIVDALILLRDQLNAVPALWCGVEDSDAYFFRSLCVLGVYTQFDIGLPYDSHAVLTLKLKEI